MQRAVKKLAKTAERNEKEKKRFAKISEKLQKFSRVSGFRPITF